MRARIRVTELMQREGLSGEVVNLFPSCHTGIIHGDDGYDVAFDDESLVGIWVWRNSTSNPFPPIKRTILGSRALLILYEWVAPMRRK